MSKVTLEQVESYVEQLARGLTGDRGLRGPVGQTGPTGNTETVSVRAPSVTSGEGKQSTEA